MDEEVDHVKLGQNAFQLDPAAVVLVDLVLEVLRLVQDVFLDRFEVFLRVDRPSLVIFFALFALYCEMFIEFSLLLFLGLGRRVIECG